jgi:hypothetical protein
LVFASFSTKGYLRQVSEKNEKFPSKTESEGSNRPCLQEENQYLVPSKDQILSYDEATQKELGYSVSEPYVGWIEYTQPYLYLKDGIKRHDDLAGGITEEEKEAHLKQAEEQVV